MNGGRIFWLVDGTNANMNNFKGNLEFIIEENELGSVNFYLIMERKSTKM